MIHLFSPYLGHWLDIYLDDIIIYTDTLSEKKIKFLCKEMKVLGRIIDDNGIRMDLRGFLGSAGFLADDIDRVWVPMSIQRAFEDVKNLAVIC